PSAPLHSPAAIPPLCTASEPTWPVRPASLPRRWSPCTRRSTPLTPPAPSSRPGERSASRAAGEALAPSRPSPERGKRLSRILQRRIQRQRRRVFRPRQILLALLFVDGAQPVVRRRERRLVASRR